MSQLIILGPHRENVLGGWVAVIGLGNGLNFTLMLWEGLGWLVLEAGFHYLRYYCLRAKANGRVLLLPWVGGLVRLRGD